MIRWLLIFSLLIPPALRAQLNGQFIESSQDPKLPFTITQFSTKQGLPENQVTALTQKGNGNMIIATANGIVEYNGSEFHPLSDKINYYTAIYPRMFWHDGSRRLFGEGHGGPTFLAYPHQDAIRWSKATCLRGDSIYCINLQGDVYAAHVKTLIFKRRFATGVHNGRCFCFHDQALFIGGLEGLYRYDLQKGQTERLSTDETYAMKVNPYNNQLYVLAMQKVFCYTRGHLSLILETQPINNTSILCQDIVFTPNRGTFVASNGGIYCLKDGKTEHYERANGLISNSIHTLFYNLTEDCLFLGTGEKGLLKLQFKNCYSLAGGQGFKESSSLSSMIQTSKGEILTSETIRDIMQIEGDTAYPYSKVQGVFASLSEVDGVVCAGSWGGGLFLIKDRELIGKIKKPQLPSNVVHGCFKDSQGRVWIGTGDGMARGHLANGFRPVLSNLVKRSIFAIYELRNGTLCLGGYEGVYLIDKNDRLIAHLDTASGLVGKEVRCLYEDAEGKLWIGLYTGGLYCYHKGKLTHINKLKNAMLDRDVFTLAKDPYGYLYISSNHGLWRILEKDLSDFYYGRKDYLVPFYYGEETGILNTEFNGGFLNNYLRASDKKFYFPTVQGAVIVSPEIPNYRKLNPRIDRIYVNDTLNNDVTHRFHRNTYSVQFDFSCAGYSDKYNVYYQYKLEKNNTAEWSPLQKGKQATFKLLPAGKYTFTLRCIDAFNDPYPTTVTYQFEILPFFYETLFFKISSLGCISVLVLITLRIRIISQKRKIEQKEFYKRKINEMELNALQAQLNPHFIFNCMNTIKYFILEKDFNNANEGLNKLSKLIRSSLENSEDMFISLGQELIFITNYIELEKMRLQEHLEYSIQIDPNIDREAMVPHLLIQPHVENAIKHGISNLENKTGKLSVTFQQENDMVVCTITDNGIGRKAARALNSFSDTKSSKGTQLAKEKSFLLNQYYNYTCTISTRDLYDEHQLSAGTQVTIQMSLKYENSHY